MGLLRTGNLGLISRGGASLGLQFACLHLGKMAVINLPAIRVTV